jgi:two-component system nitrogen regulation sensor histidine kinase NtrY
VNRRWAPRVALLAGGSAILLLALWLRSPLLPYGGDAPNASRGGPAGAAGTDIYESEVRAGALSALRASLEQEEQRLIGAATHALDAPPVTQRAFDHLAALRLSKEEGLVLFEDSVPVAWAGQVVVDPASAGHAVGISITPFYTTMTAVVERAKRRAVAMAVIHAEPPADRLATSLESKVPGRDELASYTFAAGSDTTGGEQVVRVGGVTLLRADAIPLPREMVRFSRVGVARARGSLLLGVGLLLLLTLAWRDRNLLGERLLALTICLIAIALIPWSSFSNTARIFDPTYYYSPLAGPLTANAGVLVMTAVLLLLAVYAIIRSRRVSPPRPIALAGALAMGAAGPVMIVLAAPGITHPSWGTTATLWLSWEIPLFLILFAIWLAGVWLARIALGKRGTIHLRAAAGVAVAAGFVASAIVWRTTTAERLELAAQDIRRLQRSDGDVATLLRRFATELSQYDSAGTRADLLKRYAISDLAAAELPVSLATWTNGGGRVSELKLAPVAYDSSFLVRLVVAARDSAQPLIVQTLGINGREVVMAARHPGSGVTTAVVSPRTQLAQPDPFVPLLGFPARLRTDPPYTLTISDVTANAAIAGDSIKWRRIGDELHGNRLIETSRGIARAHAEVDLRSLSARGERLVLIVILDAAITGLLWALGAMAEGGFLRWLRARSSRWVRSYRGRLTLALSAFFVIPALAFALWSYQRLRNDDRDVRELLLRETLDAVVQRADNSSIQGVPRPYNTPLFLYSNGLLSATSDSLIDELAPARRTLPVPVYLSIAARGELNASWLEDVGQAKVLFGYRAAAGPEQQRYVLAAPARSDELTLDRRRRDLTILVLFATVLGAVAAIWLSGVAAKRLARDLELSRIEVARAERVLAWGEMARQVAHEIKNPLTPIRLGVQHLRRARADARVDFDRVLDENVARILSEIDRLDEIARAFSRYGSAPSELPAAESIDVAAILRDVVALETMGVGDVSWTLVGADAPAIASARADELRDVLLNVFENARLARARNVEVRLNRLPETVQIEIADDGAGIGPAALPRVFEPHFSTRTTGSGFGLAVSRRLLEAWGGAIEIASDEGRGARVLLTLQARNERST